MYSKIAINAKYYLCIKVTLLEALDILRSGKCPAGSLTHFEDYGISYTALEEPQLVPTHDIPKDLVLNLRKQGLTSEDMTELRNALEIKANFHKENLVLLLGSNPALGNEAIRVLFKTENDKPPLDDEQFWQSNWHFDFKNNSITSSGLEHLAKKIEYFSCNELALNVQGNLVLAPLPILSDIIRRRKFPVNFSLYMQFGFKGPPMIGHIYTATITMEQWVSAIEQLAREVQPKAAPALFIHYVQHWESPDHLAHTPKIINYRILKALSLIALKRYQWEIKVRLDTILEALSNPEKTKLILNEIPLRIVLCYALEYNDCLSRTLIELSIWKHSIIEKRASLGFFHEKYSILSNQIQALELYPDKFIAERPRFLAIRKIGTTLDIDVGCDFKAKKFAEQLCNIGMDIFSCMSSFYIKEQDIKLFVVLELVWKASLKFQKEWEDQAPVPAPVSNSCILL